MCSSSWPKRGQRSLSEGKPEAVTSPLPYRLIGRPGGPGPPGERSGPTHREGDSGVGGTAAGRAIALRVISELVGADGHHGGIRPSVVDHCVWRVVEAVSSMLFTASVCVPEASLSCDESRR